MGHTQGQVERGFSDPSQIRPMACRLMGPFLPYSIPWSQEQAKGAQPILFERSRLGPRREAAYREVKVSTEDFLAIRSCELQATLDMLQRK